MAYTEKDLKQHIRSALPQKAYLLYGDESYLTSYYTEKLVAWICGEEAQDSLSFESYIGDESSIGEIAGALETISWGADRKCVLVKELDVTQLDEGTFGEWLAFLKDLPDTGTLILRLSTTTVNMKTARWSNFIKAFGENGYVVDFPLLKRNECARTLCAGAKKRNVVLEMDVAYVLIDRVGGDLRTLINEIDKLSAIAGEGETITEQMVKTVTQESLESVVFNLSGCILRGNTTRAFTLLRGLKNQKEDPLGILGILSNAYSDLYRAKVAKASGRQPEELASAFGYKQNRLFVLTNAGRDSAKISFADLRKCLDILAEADLALKSFSVDEWMIMDKLVTKLLEVHKIR